MISVMRDEFLVFGAPVIEDAEIDEVVDSLRSGWIGTGPKVDRLERMLEQYLGVEHVRCVSSGSAALLLGMEVLGVGSGDEVLLPSMTFVACANAVEHTGATPVFVDSDPDTGLIDLERAAAAVTERTRAIMPVHLAGRPVDVDAVNEFRDRHELLVIEDAAHAIGAEWRGTRIGAHGNLTAFSFYVTKNMTTIEGGAVATRDAAVAEEVERLALHGLSAGAWARFSDTGFRHYEVKHPGYKFNMTDVQASVGLHQLPRLDRWIEARARLWERYDELLAGLPLATPPPPTENMLHARHLYSVLIDPEAALTRDQLLEFLQERNIGTGVHYRAIHQHAYYRQRYARYGFEPDALAAATAISDRTLSLPLSPAVTSADQDDVVAALREGLG
jgi:dTDP-4-amino-4,6-dideoxygalactose transaminase